MKTLCNKWKTFIYIILDPWNMILLVGTITISFILVNQNYKNEPADNMIVALLTVLLSIASGILGGQIGKKWDEIIEESVLVARGKAAIRSLNLLLGSTVALKKRSQDYLFNIGERSNNKKIDLSINTLFFEEIINRCKLLESEIIGSIENWIDVTPEADIKSQISGLRKISLEVINLKKESERMGKELKKIKNKSSDEIKKLRNEKQTVENELSEARQILIEKASDAGSILGADLYIGPGITTLGGGSAIFNYATLDGYNIKGLDDSIIKGGEKFNFIQGLDQNGNLIISQPKKDE